MRVGLGAACGIRGLSVFRWFAVIAIICAVPAIPAGNFAITMRMAGHLLHRQRRLADSAGQTFLIAAMRHNQELSYASSYRSSLR